MKQDVFKVPKPPKHKFGSNRKEPSDGDSNSINIQLTPKSDTRLYSLLRKLCSKITELYPHIKPEFVSYCDYIQSMPEELYQSYVDYLSSYDFLQFRKELESVAEEIKDYARSKCKEGL